MHTLRRDVERFEYNSDDIKLYVFILLMTLEVCHMQVTAVAMWCLLLNYISFHFISFICF